MSNISRSGKWLPVLLVAIFVLAAFFIFRTCLRTEHAAGGFQGYSSADKGEKATGSPARPEVQRPALWIQVNDSTGLPAIAPGEEVISHMAFSLSYNEEHEQANWVAYMLTPGRLNGREQRSDDFRPDLKVTTGSATLGDYYNSGYDRGHLVPAADMKWSARAMSETFYLSNISPQNSIFNQSIWNDLEQQVRDWARNDSLLIVTGPVLKGINRKIGRNKVSVPPAFYKVILDVQGPEVKSIAFIIPNSPQENTFWRFAVPVDKVESITGIDFFPQLPDSLEASLEKEMELSAWRWLP